MAMGDMVQHPDWESVGLEKPTGIRNMKVCKCFQEIVPKSHDCPCDVEGGIEALIEEV